MEPEVVINGFLEVIKNQPELFDDKSLLDLPELELVIERLEYEEDEEKVELAADAIIDFCDSNHQVGDAITKAIEGLQAKRKYRSFYSEVQIINNTLQEELIYLDLSKYILVRSISQILN